jgi:hypothetical protein
LPSSHALSRARSTVTRPTRPFAGAYFHKGYDLDAPTAAGIIRNYLEDEDQGAIRQLAAEIKTILDSDMI